MFLPSRPLREALASGRLDDAEFARDYRFSESDRAWNRGSSQRQTRELKEAYLDIELLDSNLWLRVGKQTIVWGKTELFRTIDQFNPQDLGLASLPSLEESRVPSGPSAESIHSTTWAHWKTCDSSSRSTTTSSGPSTSASAASPMRSTRPAS
jgi:hypothetical protein